MDWFERLTGFRETSYHDTRAKLKLDGNRLQSLINGKDYGIGELELVSLQALRERVQSGAGLPGRLKASVVTGDVRQMHQSSERRPHARLGVRNRRWRGHDLPQLLRASRWRLWPDCKAPVRRVGRILARLWESS